MESGSSYRVYRSSDLYSIPPTAITKKSHVADDGVGWSGFAFLVAVGVAIGGASLAAMHVVKPDAPPRTTAAISAPAPMPAPVPAPVVANPPAPLPIAVPVEAPKVDGKVDAKASKPVAKPRRALKTKSDPVPTNPYDATTADRRVDRGLPPAL